MLNIDLKKNVNYSTRDRIYEFLRKSIISLELEPGKNISEKEISGMLNVSRTPVREAFARLSQEELLEVYPQRGTFISLIDLNQVEQSRFIREHLERAAVRVACENFPEEYLLQLELNFSQQQQCFAEQNHTKLFELDEEFHHIITLGSGKEKIWNIIQTMNAHLNRVRMLSLAAHHNWASNLFQHSQIIEAIKNKQPDFAEQIMEKHLKKLAFEQEKLKNDYSHYFNGF
ncbi:GntR family transcriptional regulator [Gracilibacillus sp. D59]|uniref:GntR family transcriptional regulator n=1 Tax=Gracilibacillus sp. D59 TaxID=3457434 RepID=UPI003FCED7BF